MGERNQVLSFLMSKQTTDIFINGANIYIICINRKKDKNYLILIEGWVAEVAGYAEYVPH